MLPNRRSPQPGTETSAAFWLTAGAALAMVGLLRFGYFYIGDVMRGDAGLFLERVINESTGAATAFLVVFGIGRIWQRHPLERGRSYPRTSTGRS